MGIRFITIDGLEFNVPDKLYETEFQAIYADYVLLIGGNVGVGVMGKMGWDASHRNKFRGALKNVGIEIHKNPPDVLPGFELDSEGRVVRSNRGEFPL